MGTSGPNRDSMVVREISGPKTAHGVKDDGWTYQEENMVIIHLTRQAL